MVFKNENVETGNSIPKFTVVNLYGDSAIKALNDWGGNEGSGVSTVKKLNDENKHDEKEKSGHRRKSKTSK